MGVFLWKEFTEPVTPKQSIEAKEKLSKWVKWSWSFTAEEGVYASAKAWHGKMNSTTSSSVVETFNVKWG